MTRAARAFACFTMVVIGVLRALGQTAPIANAGPDVSASLGDVVTLDGTQSTVPGGGAPAYAWSLPIKPEGSRAKLANATTARPSFTVDVPGVYVASLVVRSGLQESAPDVVVVTAINRPPTADAGPDLVLRVGETAVLDGTQTFDLDFDRLTYQWAFVLKPDCSRAVLVEAASAIASFLVDCPGAYLVQLRANDAFSSGIDGVLIRTADSPPVANAGRDQTSAVGATVRLDGSGSSDADASPIHYAWSFASRPLGSVAVLSDFETAFPSFVADVPGAYRINLIVNDGSAVSVADTVTVSTNNSAPVADAGRDQHVSAGQFARLDGSRSTDADGQTLRYAWTIVSRPNGSFAFLDDSSAVRPALQTDLAGTYVLALVVHDGFVASQGDVVRVSTDNVAPVANAGPDQAAHAGSIVRISGAGSTDPDGDELGFRWALISQPPGSTALLFNVAAVRPALVPDQPGSYVVQLIVTDGRAISAPDSVVVTVGNAAPAAEAGVDRTIPVGFPTALDATASRDPNDDALTYRWSLLSRPFGSTARIQAPESAVTFFTPDVPGTYVASLSVNDGSVSSAPDAVVLTTLNSLPVAEAGPGQEVRTGTVVSLDGTASNDADGEFLAYRWSLIVRPLASRAELTDTPSATPAFTADAAGTYLAQLIVVDSFGASAPSTVLVIAANHTNVAPLANAGDDRRAVPGTVVELDGRGSSDPDGDTLTYRWTLTAPAGSFAVLEDAASATPFFVPDVAGRYTAQLLVNDGEFDSTDDVVIVANQQPIATITANLTAIVGDVVALDGQDSSDPDGQPLTYAWTLLKPPASRATLTNPESASASFVADVEGEFVAQLVVHDGIEASEPARAVITVTPRPIQTIACGETVPGSIEDSRQTREFTFAGTANQAVVVAAVGTSGLLAPVADLFDPNGILRFRTVANRQSISARLTISGTYRIVVHDDNLADTGTFNLNLQSSTGGCGETIACGATLGGVVPGARNVSGLPQAQQDGFTFSGTQNDAVAIAAVATGGAIAPVAELYDPAGVLRVRTQPNRQSISVRLPATGTYTILVHDDNLVDGGTYNVGMVSTGGTCGRGITCGQTLAGAAPGEGNATGQPQAQQDAYTFDGLQGEAVVFAAVATSDAGIAPVAELYDPAGVLRVRTIANRPSISVRLPATGRYTLVVHDDNLTDGGSYNVNLQFSTGRCAAALACGLPIVATIPGADNGTSLPRAEQDAYGFTGLAGESVTFEAIGVEGVIAPVAELYDPAGVLRFRTVANRTSTPVSLPVSGRFTIVVHDDDLRDGGGYRVAFTRAGGCPPVARASVEPATLAFGDQPVGTPSAPQTVTVTSSGTGPLTIGTIAAATPHFQLPIEANHCSGRSVAAGTSCTFDVMFTPQVEGPLSDTVTIPSDAVNQPHAVSVSGTGTRTPCAPQLSPNPAAWFDPILGTGDPRGAFRFVRAETGVPAGGTVLAGDITSAHTSLVFETTLLESQPLVWLWVRFVKNNVRIAVVQGAGWIPATEPDGTVGFTDALPVNGVDNVFLILERTLQPGDTTALFFVSIDTTLFEPGLEIQYGIVEESPNPGLTPVAAAVLGCAGEAAAVPVAGGLPKPLVPGRPMVPAVFQIRVAPGRSTVTPFVP